MQLTDPKLQLLSTIRLPNNLKLLSDRLPKSKYDEDVEIGETTQELAGSSSLILPSSEIVIGAKHILV